MPEETDDYIPAGIFEEPAAYSAPIPQETLATYNTLSNHNLIINLVGSSPLYGHILTNACLQTAKYLEKNADTVVMNKCILEVGAGGALPSILCAYLGAKYVICTDYPDANLIQNIGKNIKENKLTENCTGIGYIWGNDTDEITNTLKLKTNNANDSFDLIILSDVIFNHSEHDKLLTTCKKLISKNSDGKVLVTFSPHRPKLLDDDMSFFTKCEDFGFRASQLELVHYSPLFKDDTDESTVEIRSRVYVYILSQK